MASPPFSIAETVPADDDVAAQFPATERTFRDIVESWFLVEGNTNGRSNKRAFDWIATPSGVASVTTVWADTDGYLLFRRGTGNAMYLEEAPGTVKFTAAAAADEGWLLCFGQAVSRTTYARLFARIGTTYGAGDGSTTFNLPAGEGRGLFGKDNMSGSAAGRITTAGSGIDGTTLGATGGAQAVTLTRANLPNETVSVTIGAGQGSHVHTTFGNTGGSGGIQAAYLGAGGGTGFTVDTAAATLPAMTGTGTLNGGVTQTTVNKMPGAIILNMQIKY